MRDFELTSFKTLVAETSQYIFLIETKQLSES